MKSLDAINRYQDWTGLTGVMSTMLSVLMLGLTAVMILAVWLQMLVRWILSPYFGLTMPWTGSISTMAMVMLTFIGAAVASRDNDHVRISILLNKLSGVPKRTLSIVNNLLVLVFLIIFTIGTFSLATQMGGLQYQTLPAIPPLTRDWLYLVAAIGGVAMLIYTIRNISQNVRGSGETDSAAGFDDEVADK